MAIAGNIAIARLLRAVFFFASFSAMPTIPTIALAAENAASTLPVTSSASLGETVNSAQKSTPTIAKSTAPLTSPPPKQAITASKPSWSELNPQQQQALAPLVNEWDKIDSFRKKKWLEIGNKFPAMKPDEQQRVQDRMREWAKLTPEQRRIARENYTRTKKLDSDQKSERWQQYQQLSEEQKQKLAGDAEKKKRVSNLHSQHSKTTTVPPIKSTPKPVLEQSVTPKVTKQSPIQPSAPPANK